MPVQYEGIAMEHRQVRDRVGIFDISHMGEFEVEGAEAVRWLDARLSNRAASLSIGQGQYTLLLNDAGGVIDDLLLYRLGENHYFMVVNAARVERDRECLIEAKPEAQGVVFRDRSSEYGAVAVQGPESLALWEKIGEEVLLPQRNCLLQQGNALICRTGYTGEDGYEIFAPNEEIGSWWDRLTAAGAAPCGLGARDTLRLEKCYPLNGNDLDEVHTALEAGLAPFVKLDKGDGFVGSSALLAQRDAGIPTRLTALRVIDKAPPLRHGYPILSTSGGPTLSELTSGTLSPSLNVGIGLAYLPLAYSKPGRELLISIRGREFRAEVVKKPFL